MQVTVAQGGKSHMSNREELKQILHRAKEQEKARLQEEIALIKSLKGKTRLVHIFEYYKLHMVILVIVLYFSIGGIWNIVNPPPQPIITIAWMGGFLFEDERESIENAFIAAMIDEDSQQGRRRQTVRVISFSPTGRPSFDTASLSHFAALVSAREIDMLIGYAGQTTEELLENAPVWAFKNVEHIVEHFALPREYILYFEEEGWEPLPHALFICGNTFFEELDILTERRYLAVMSNTQREDAVLDAIRVIFEYPYN